MAPIKAHKLNEGSMVEIQEAGRASYELESELLTGGYIRHCVGDDHYRDF